MQGEPRPATIPLDYPETWHLYRAEPRMYLGFKEHCEEIAPKDALSADILLFGAGKGPRITAPTSRPTVA